MEQTKIGGEFGNAMLLSGFGARSQGLGNATAAIFDHTANPFKNTSGMSFHNGYRIVTGGSILSLGRREGYISYAHQIKPRGTFGIAWFYRGDPSIRLIDNESEKFVGTGSESVNNFNIGLAYRVFKRTAIGATISFYFHNIFYEPEKKVNIFSVGNLNFSLAKIMNKHWTIATTIKNLKFIGETDSWRLPTGFDLEAVQKVRIPYVLNLGSSYRRIFQNREFLVSVEENLFLWEDQDGGLRFWQHTDHVGAEVWLYPRFSIRTGYDDGRFPIGIGIRNIIKGSELNYAFSFERNSMGYNNNMEWIWQF